MGNVRFDFGGIMKTYLRAALSASFVFAVPGTAQTVAPPTPQTTGPATGSASAAIVPIAGPVGTAVLRVGTPVPLKMSETITTKGKKLKVGYRIHLEVAEDVRVDGVVVIPIGSPAIGEVTDVRNKGMWGKSGKINAQLLYVTVNGRQIRLSGQFDDKGVAGGVGAAAVSAVVFLPAGFFMTGTSAKIDLGAPVKGFVDEDVPLNLTAAAPAPMTVTAPAPPAVTAQPANVAAQPAANAAK